MIYYIENKEGSFIQHIGSDKIQYQNNGKNTGMTAECQILINDSRYNPSNLVAKSITINPETEKVADWEGIWPNISAKIIPADWDEEDKPIRVTCRAKKIKALKDKKDFLFTQLKKEKWVDGKLYAVTYLDFARLDDDFELNAGVISNTDTDLIVEQIRNDFVIREIDEDQCIAPPI